MATIQQSNLKAWERLKDIKHFKHAMSSNPVRRLLYDRFGFDVWKLPICERCEGYAFWDKGGVGTCPKCGHTTKKPLTVQQFYEEGHHVDRRVQRDAPFIVDREVVTKRDVATVYAGEAGLPDAHRKIIIARS